tara:strand:+ start:181 stop:855 length:675 start_codon:yes stop_codon:yes gene_type:complete
LAKRLSNNERDEILKAFANGSTLDQLSDQFKFTKLTISRNLKKKLGDQKYQDLFKRNKSARKNIKNQINNNPSKTLTETIHINDQNSNVFDEENYTYKNQSQDAEFIEIVPLNFDIDNAKRKDISSVPIENVDLPNIVYMVVDKNIELETKFLSEYPNWQFLPQEDLNRKTIEIFYDLKAAKRNCNKNQKVIKVPNSKVFEIVAPILISKGISRIVSEEVLISL